MDKISCCSTSLSPFGVASVVDFHRSNWCVVVPHSFHLHFLLTFDVGHFVIFYWQSVYLFGDLSIQVFCLSLNQVV